MIERLNSVNYAPFLKMAGFCPQVCFMLPDVWGPEFWGVVAIDSGQVVGGWCGRLRGNSRLISFLAKSVYFDSMPVCPISPDGDNLKSEIYEAACSQAREDGVVMFCLTHWVREDFSLPALKEKCATFVIDLSRTEAELWAGMDSKQRNIVRKGDKNGVSVEVCTGARALSYLTDFQRLRQVTQSRAVRRNSNASMLLKSDSFFSGIMMMSGSTLFVGKFNGEVASVALMLRTGDTVFYYSGGSERDVNRKTGCSAYLIWSALRYYNQCGDVRFFDMGGVPVNPDSNHPAYGVYSFKKSFGGEYREYACGKIPVCRWKYAILEWVLGKRRLVRFFSRRGV